MNIPWVAWLRAPIKMWQVTHRVIKNKRGAVHKLRADLVNIKAALAQEKDETQAMLASYRRYTQGHATKDEMKAANEQLVDLLKGLGIGVFAILPFAPLTIPAIIALGKRLGVDVLPSAFYEQKNDTEAKE